MLFLISITHNCLFGNDQVSQMDISLLSVKRRDIELLISTI